MSQPQAKRGRRPVNDPSTSTSPSRSSYAIRVADRAGWDIVTIAGTAADIGAWYARCGREVREIRPLPARRDHEDDDTDGRSSASESWWRDPFRGCWRAPDEFIEQPYDAPIVSASLAVAIGPPGAGWLRIILASPRQVAVIHMSHVFASGAELVTWLEGIARGAFPRMAIDEEGTFVELHTFPIRQDLLAKLRSPSTADSHLRLLVVQVGTIAPYIMLDVIIPRRALVRSVYRSWLAARDDDPARFESEWLRFGCEADDPGMPFARSPLIEEWLAKPEAPEG